MKSSLMKFPNNAFKLGMIVILLMGMTISFANKGGSQKALLKVGDPFPSFILYGSLTDQEQEYLGLKDTKKFRLKDIQAKIIVVEFFNKFCPNCQEQAPILNKLYKSIQQNMALRDKVKMLGIGNGNNQYQLETFRTEEKFPIHLFRILNILFMIKSEDLKLHL